MKVTAKWECDCGSDMYHDSGMSIGGAKLESNMKVNGLPVNFTGNNYPIYCPVCNKKAQVFVGAYDIPKRLDS